MSAERDALSAIAKVARRVEEGAQFQSDEERLDWIAAKAESALQGRGIGPEAGTVGPEEGTIGPQGGETPTE